MRRPPPRPRGRIADPQLVTSVVEAQISSLDAILVVVVAAKSFARGQRALGVSEEKAAADGG